MDGWMDGRKEGRKEGGKDKKERKIMLITVWPKEALFCRTVLANRALSAHQAVKSYECLQISIFETHNLSFLETQDEYGSNKAANFELLNELRLANSTNFLLFFGFFFY